MAWAPFEARFPVRFGLCDPAKIIYFPNYFDFFHGAMEDFFRDRLGTQYHVLLNKDRISFPTVHLEVDFASPVAYGDEVRIGSIDLIFRLFTLSGSTETAGRR